jgi:hypothetical protein
MVYKNFVYTYRRTLEALRAGGVAHVTKGLVWIQGLADAGRRWDEFGPDEKRVLDALRCDLGHYRLPIVSQGSGYIDHLRSGKALAQASVEGCNLVVLEMALAAHKAPRYRGDVGEIMGRYGEMALASHKAHTHPNPSP